MMLEAVIFDLDGVLIDSEMKYMTTLRCFVRDDFGKDIPQQELLAIVGATGPAHWLAAAPYLPSHWQREDFRAAYHNYLLRNPIDYAALVFPDVLPGLKALQQAGLRMAMATSSPAEKADAVIEQCGFAPYLEFALTGDRVTKSKPDPQIYNLCVERLGLTPDRCAAVEDSSIGIASARGAGLVTIARREERYPLDQSAAHYSVSGITEVAPLIAGL